MMIKSRAGLLGFVLAVSAAAIVLGSGADFLTVRYGLPEHGPVHVVTTVLVCALPISWFVGARLMQLNRLKDQLEITSRYDRLTGLLNRPTFMDMLAELPPRTGAVALLDVDFFKRVNDTHGHFVGDKVLAHVARCLSQSCRPGDMICRFGGEEFAVLFADAGVEMAQRLAADMVRSVAESALSVDGHSHHLTISLGYALAGDGIDPAQALQSADQALYRAKAQGRNRAVAAWDAEPPQVIRPAA